MCPEVFPDRASLRDHLDNSPRHKIRPKPDDTVSNLLPPISSSRRRPSKATAAEVEAELAAMAQRPRLTVNDLPPSLAAEHERLSARERQLAKPKGA